MSNNRRHHPQVIRAKELAREAGHDPYEQVPMSRKRKSADHLWEHDCDGTYPIYKDFIAAAFREHFKRTAIDNVNWDNGGSFYIERWDVDDREQYEYVAYGLCKSGRRWFWIVRFYGFKYHDKEHAWHG
jgi:hypothetical protein